ncbi:MAG: hypothetical protein O9275_23830 [Microcystis sp. LE19-196.1B]|nr:hypothetical protein [Microcystis sp. LE19-196.1B]
MNKIKNYVSILSLMILNINCVSFYVFGWTHYPHGGHQTEYLKVESGALATDLTISNGLILSSSNPIFGLAYGGISILIYSIQLKDKFNNIKSYQVYVNSKEDFVYQTSFLYNSKDIMDFCMSNYTFCLEAIDEVKKKLKSIDEKIDTTDRVWKSNFKSINYGCYCREKIDFRIFKVCPIDNNSLDNLCKVRQDCLTAKNLKWDSRTICDTTFINSLKKIKSQIVSESSNNSNQMILSSQIEKYLILFSI